MVAEAVSRLTTAGERKEGNASHLASSSGRLIHVLSGVVYYVILESNSATPPHVGRSRTAATAIIPSVPSGEY